MVLKMFFQVPKFFKTIQRERRETEKLVSEFKIDLVISDNRFGCWSQKVPSVLVSHQLNILMPKGWGWLKNFVDFVYKRLLQKFDARCVPDLPGSVLSGKLSMDSDQETAYIGLLSRFKQPTSLDPVYDLCAVLSGPEPQRSILENILLAQFLKSGLKCIIVRGVNGQERKHAGPSVEIVDFLNTGDLERTILQSKVVIARPGYSTLMDLAKLSQKGIFIPTPGQTEQEYLAERIKAKGIAFTIDQEEFSLPMALSASANYSGFAATDFSDALLEQCFKDLVRRSDLVSTLS
jgi:UDP-N-acetylglucosamine transferase subunit ALG13